MVGKSFKKRVLCFLVASLINNSNQFNLDNFFTRRSFLKTTLSSMGLITLNANNIYLDNDDLNENNIEKNLYSLNSLSDNTDLSKKSHFLNNNIYFTGSLNEETCFKLTEALINYKNLALTNQDFPNHINLYIQSPGGSLLPTLAVVDEIQNLGIPVHTYIRGYAASAATLLSVVGSRRFIYSHSLIMIHGVKISDSSVSTLLDIKDLNKNIDLFMNIIKEIYMENTNINEDILENLFYHDIWMNSSLALEYGLVDEIL
jgi:ATP-dependent Clp protease protease subunit